MENQLGVINLPLSPVGSHVRNDALGQAVEVAVPAGARQFIFSVETQAIRLTLDGTTPTAAIGFPYATATTPYMLPVTEGVTLAIIAQVAGAVINYQFSR